MILLLGGENALTTDFPFFMNLQKKTLDLIAACLSFILIIILLTIFASPYKYSPVNYCFIWLLLLGIISGWIRWKFWGGAFFLISIVMVTVYFGLVTGQITYPLEIIPAGILFYMLVRKTRQNETITTELMLENDRRERAYNLLLEEQKKQHYLRESYYKKTTRFSRLSQIAKELGFTLAPGKLGRNLISNLIKTIENGDSYSFYTIKPDLQNLELQIIQGPRNEIIDGKHLPDKFDVWVLRNRQPLIVADVIKDYRFSTRDAKDKTRSRSLIISPLITGNRLLGMIRIDSYTPNTFNIDDLRLLTIISNIGALAFYNTSLYQQTEHLAVRDDLTGAFVKRYFAEQMEKLIIKSQLQQEPFTVLLMDLDKFKELNDQFGHTVGDKILKKVTILIQKGSSPQGITARYGGEEFAVILPQADKQQGINIAETIRTLIEQAPLTARRQPIRITTSIGLVTFPAEGNTTIELLDKADKRLYRAKDKGRNRVVAE